MISSIASEPVNRTANTRGATVQDMGIDHGRLDVVVAQEPLNRTDVIATPNWT